ncbi:MAG: hypothetical protein WD599_01515 [Balneolaceae bacterium]
MNSEKLLLELESLCEQSGYRVRKERGTFRGDHCVIEGDKLILINKNRPVEAQVGILAKVLKSVKTENIYIKPAVRKRMQEIWDRMEKNRTREAEELDQ